MTALSIGAVSDNIARVLTQIDQHDSALDREYDFIGRRAEILDAIRNHDLRKLESALAFTAETYDSSKPQWPAEMREPARVASGELLKMKFARQEPDWTALERSLSRFLNAA